jgi:hypothetical protein
MNKSIKKPAIKPFCISRNVTDQDIHPANLNKMSLTKDFPVQTYNIRNQNCASFIKTSYTAY